MPSNKHQKGWSEIKKKPVKPGPKLTFEVGECKTYKVNGHELSILYKKDDEKKEEEG